MLLLTVLSGGGLSWEVLVQIHSFVLNEIKASESVKSLSFSTVVAFLNSRFMHHKFWYMGLDYREFVKEKLSLLLFWRFVSVNQKKKLFFRFVEYSTNPDTVDFLSTFSPNHTNCYFGIFIIVGIDFDISFCSYQWMQWKYFATYVKLTALEFRPQCSVLWQAVHVRIEFIVKYDSNELESQQKKSLPARILKKCYFCKSKKEEKHKKRTLKESKVRKKMSKVAKIIAQVAIVPKDCVQCRYVLGTENGVKCQVNVCCSIKITKSKFVAFRFMPKLATKILLQH